MIKITKEKYVLGMFEPAWHKKWLISNSCFASVMTVFIISVLAVYVLLWGNLWATSLWIMVFIPQLIWQWIQFGMSYAKWIISLELNESQLPSRERAGHVNGKQ